MNLIERLKQARSGLNRQPEERQHEMMGTADELWKQGNLD